MSIEPDSTLLSRDYESTHAYQSLVTHYKLARRMPVDDITAKVSCYCLAMDALLQLDGMAVCDYDMRSLEFFEWCQAFLAEEILALGRSTAEGVEP